jgi:hypothetical protein
VNINRRNRIVNLNYELMSFNITASDIEIHVSPTELDNVKTRIDTPGSVYGVYEKNSDKIRVHVPITVAAKYVQ